MQLSSLEPSVKRMQTRAVTTRGSVAVAPFPLVDLQAQYRALKAEVDAAMQRVMDSQQFILGPEVENFEKEVADYCGTRFAIACASGSDALLLALMALEVGSGDEVVTTPFTFVATAGSVARLGARPVFVDIDPRTYNIDPAKLGTAITSKTKAIIPVHLFGMSADMDVIMKIATQRGIPIIEDAAQAIGATYAGKPVGSIGLCGCFSFFPSKNLGGAGDGGMLTTNDEGFADKLRVLHLHGGHTKYEYELIGMNSRLDALQAAILRVKLRHLDSWSDGRKRKAAKYAELFAKFGLDHDICLPQTQTNSSHIYNQYVIRSQRRDELKTFLRDCGVPSEVYYPLPLHLQQAFAYLGYKHGDFPESEAASKEVLALPVFPEMTEDQQNLVVESIATFYRDSAGPQLSRDR
jgi:dTDP-4-amino-4,6-dideoxygalactose transaminase